MTLKSFSPLKDFSVRLREFLLVEAPSLHVHRVAADFLRVEAWGGALWAQPSWCHPFVNVRLFDPPVPLQAPPLSSTDLIPTALCPFSVAISASRVTRDELLFVPLALHADDFVLKEPASKRPCLVLHVNSQALKAPTEMADERLRGAEQVARVEPPLWGEKLHKALPIPAAVGPRREESSASRARDMGPRGKERAEDT